MSYDLEVWSTEWPDIAAVLDGSAGWEVLGQSTVWAGAGSQIVVGTPVAVASEDVPDAMSRALVGIRFHTEITIQPISASAATRAWAMKAARAIARAAHGVVHDPQDSSVKTPAGVKRGALAPPRERFSALTLNWWFTSGPLLKDAGVRSFVALLAQRLPEALPRRYGIGKPPDHKLATTGIEGLNVFLAREMRDPQRFDYFTWYPSQPTLSVTFGVRRDWGVQRAHGFRCSHISIAFDAVILDQAGWQHGLSELWVAASRVIRPFYAEVRTIAGCYPSVGGYLTNAETEIQPVRGGEWRGIPRAGAHASVCGSDYLAAWPAFATKARHIDGLGFVSADCWRPGYTTNDLIGPPPEDIAQRWTPHYAPVRGGISIKWNTEYPERWPLGSRPTSLPSGDF
jgi:hypothetical protein